MYTFKLHQVWGASEGISLFSNLKNKSKSQCNLIALILECFFFSSWNLIHIFWVNSNKTDILFWKISFYGICWTHKHWPYKTNIVNKIKIWRKKIEKYITQTMECHYFERHRRKLYSLLWREEGGSWFLQLIICNMKKHCTEPAIVFVCTRQQITVI